MERLPKMCQATSNISTGYLKINYQIVNCLWSSKTRSLEDFIFLKDEKWIANISSKASHKTKTKLYRWKLLSTSPQVEHHPKLKITRTLPCHKTINELYLNVSNIKGLCNCFFKSAGLNMDSYNNFTQYLTNTDTPDWIELDCMSVCCVVTCWAPHQICTK